MVVLKMVCQEGHINRWATQPLLGTLPRGNLDISAAILFSGSIVSKCINFMRHMKMYTITTKTFHRVQKFYLIPAIFQVWHIIYYKVI